MMSHITIGVLQFFEALLAQHLQVKFGDTRLKPKTQNLPQLMDLRAAFPEKALLLRGHDGGGRSGKHKRMRMVFT